MTTNLTKHSPALVIPVTILPPGRHMRVPSPLPASTVCGQCAHSLHVAWRMAAVSEGEHQFVLRFAGPAGQGHAFGLIGDVGQGVAVRRPEGSKMGGGAGDDAHGHDKVPGAGAADGDIQVLHDSTLPDGGQA